MCHSIRLLRQNGYRVHALDGNPRSPGFALSDDHDAIDFSDVEEVIKAARRVRADLILGVNEPGVWSAAQASERIGLPNIPTDVAWRCLHKGKMRQAWDLAGLPQPQFRVITDLDEVGDAAVQLGYPVVLKPAFGWGSRGVSVISGPEDIAWSCDFARTNSRSSDFIVERCLPGIEVTVEGLVKDGRVQVLATSDKEHQAHTRYRVAMALNYPADLSAPIAEKLETTMIRAVLALGLRDAAFHAECIVDDDDVYLVEAAARGGGGHIFGIVVEAVSGVPMPLALVRILLGEAVDIRPRYRRAACYRFFSPPSGLFREAIGVEEARGMPGILDLGFEMARGTRVAAISCDAARPGFVVSTGATRDEAMANARRAIAAVKFVMSEAETEAHGP